MGILQGGADDAVFDFIELRSIAAEIQPAIQESDRACIVEYSHTKRIFANQGRVAIL